jgi:hypothetical protein
LHPWNSLHKFALLNFIKYFTTHSTWDDFYFIFGDFNYCCYMFTLTLNNPNYV